MTQDELKVLIEDLISAIEYHVEQTRPIHSTTIALQAARDALKSLPPQRTWVELTDDEIWEAYMKAPLTLDCSTDELYALARTVEAKLKDKNNV